MVLAGGMGGKDEAHMKLEVGTQRLPCTHPVLCPAGRAERDAVQDSPVRAYHIRSR